MLWMQQNIWCIASATFKMIAMTSTSSSSVLSAVRPKQARLTVAVLIPPLANPPPLNQPEILLLPEWHRWPHIGHQVWISVNDPHGRTCGYTYVEKRRRSCVKTAIETFQSSYKGFVSLPSFSFLQLISPKKGWVLSSSQVLSLKPSLFSTSLTISASHRDLEFALKSSG